MSTEANALNINSANPLEVYRGGTGAATITGLVSGNGTNAFVARTITGTANQVAVANGDGSSANPTLSLTSVIHVDGISFDAGTNSLDDYEEGTFTPTVTSSGTPPTVGYSIQNGYYQRIGNRVTVNLLITLSSYTAGTGFLRIAGLPFTSENVTNNRSTAALLGSNITFTQNYITGLIQANTDFFAIWATATGGAGTSLSSPAFAANTSVSITGSYQI